MDKQRITKERMEAIEKATQDFMTTNYRRPCPADGGIGISDPEFGLEVTGANCTGGEVFSDSDVNVVVGTVPTKTLGLPNEYALDGYGRRMMYFVDKRAANSNMANGMTCIDLQNSGTKPALQIAENFIDVAARETVMWALVSYGKDGYGTFPLSGSAKEARLDTGAADDNTIFNALDASGDTAFGTDTGSGVLNGTRLAKPSTSSSTVDDLIWYSEPTKNTCAIGKLASDGFRITRSGENLISGTSMNARIAKGDINGDGIQDLVIGRYYGATTRGVVYVLYGRNSGWPANTSEDDFMDLDTMPSGTENGSRGFKIGDSASYTYLGHTLATGDVNGDGFDDIIIGGNQRFLIVYGNTSKANMLGADLTTDSVEHLTNPLTSRTVIVTGINTLSGDIATGDLNGDGYDEIVMSTHNANGTISTRSYTYVLFGKDTTSWDDTGTITLGTTANANGFNLTTTIAPAKLTPTDDEPIDKGAIENDFPQYAYLRDVANDARLFEDKETTSSTHLSMSEYKVAGSIGGGLEPTPLVQTDGFGAGEYTLDIGDVNGDGFEDIAFGGSSAQQYGKVYVLFGKSAATPGWSPDTSTNKDMRVLTAMVGNGVQLNIDANNVTETQFGRAVHLADMNNDGFKDIIVAGNKNLYITYGAATFNPATRDVSAAGTTDADVIINLGSHSTVSGISSGDLNGDGRNDLIIGDYSQPATSKGSVHVIFGPAGGWSSTYTLANITTPTDRLYIVPGTSASYNSRFVHHALPIDLNSDGKLDLAVSVPTYTMSTGRKGGVYLLYGRKNIPWVNAGKTDINLSDLY